jgi:hypothetical protein
MRLRSFQAGEAVFSAGEMASAAYWIVTGRVCLTLAGSPGLQRRLLLLGPGDHLGTLAALNDDCYPVNAVADTDCCLLRVASEDLLELYERHPGLAKHLLRRLGVHLPHSVHPRHRHSASGLVGLVSHSASASAIVPALATELARCGEHVTVFSDTLQQQPHQPWRLRRLQRDGEPLDLAGLQSFAAAGRRVLLDFPWESGRRVTMEAMEACDRVLWLVDTPSAGSAYERFRDVSDCSAELLRRMTCVRLLGPEEPVVPAGADAWHPGRFGLRIQMPGDSQPSAWRHVQGVQRMARFLRGIRIGLALGGGGARGMAHLGVLQALDRAGIGFDVIAGTSAGALAGIPYAAGYSPPFAIEGFPRHLTPSRLWRMLPGGERLYLAYQYRTGGWERMLRPYLFDWTLEQLPLPVRAVSVDLVRGREVVRHSGDAVHAILESINLPLFSPPIQRDGRLLVDGGVLNTLPTKALAECGADLIVGVSVSGRIRQEFAGQHPGPPTRS